MKTFDLESGSARMVDLAPMKKLETRNSLAILTALAAGLIVSSPAFAGPSTPAMASAANASVTTIELSIDNDAPTFESLPAAPIVLQANANDLFADADEVSPTDPHPMIPLPPAVWAGFAGLAFVTNRVLKRRPFAVR